MNNTASPQLMLPPQMVASMIRNGGSPNSMFPQNPLATGIQPGAMGADPTLQTPPPAGSGAQNMSMPPGSQQGNPMMPQAGQPDQAIPGQQPQISESEMILQALMKRLESHSKLTHKTADTLISMIQAGLPIPGADPSQGGTPPAA